MKAEARALLADVGTMLGGRAVDAWPVGAPIPTWVRINQLAHATPADLDRLADRPPAWQPSVWDDAVMFLAEELRAGSASAEELADLQHDALIPLELDLLAHRTDDPKTPVDLVALVQGELARARSRRRAAGPPAGRERPAT